MLYVTVALSILGDAFMRHLLSYKVIFNVIQQINVIKIKFFTFPRISLKLLRFFSCTL